MHISPIVKSKIACSNITNFYFFSFFPTVSFLSNTQMLLIQLLVILKSTPKHYILKYCLHLILKPVSHTLFPAAVGCFENGNIFNVREYQLSFTNILTDKYHKLHSYPSSHDQPPPMDWQPTTHCFFILFTLKYCHQKKKAAYIYVHTVVPTVGRFWNLSRFRLYVRF